MRDLLSIDVRIAYKLANSSLSIRLVDITDDVLQLTFTVLQSCTVKIIALMLKVHDDNSLIIRKDEIQYLLIGQLLKELLDDGVGFDVLLPYLKIYVEDVIEAVLIPKIKGEDLYEVIYVVKLIDFELFTPISVFVLANRHLLYDLFKGFYLLLVHFLGLEELYLLRWQRDLIEVVLLFDA